MQHLVVTALTVFFLWAGLVYPLISPWVAGALRIILFAAVVFLIALFVLAFPYPEVYFPMAVAGLVAVLHRWCGEYGTEAPTATVVRERQGRIPPSGV